MGPSGGNQRIALSADRHGGRYAAIDRGATAIQVQQPSVTENLISQQVLGTNVSTFTLDVPKIAAMATADVDFSAPLGLPSFTLNKNATGIVIVSLELTEQGKNLMVTFSQQLSYGGVAPSNSWVIPQGGTFAGGKVVGVARVLALAAEGSEMLTVLCSAKVLGIPSSGAL